MSIINNTLNFLDNSPSTFHAIKNVKNILLDNGYVELFENQPFNLVRGNKYFVTRNDSSLIAFNVGTANLYNIVATHSDSPTWKIKPNSDIKGNNYTQLSTEGYGGMIISTWLDRPLSIAGRVIANGESKLVNIDKDLLIIPNVCIHFNRNINEGYAFNKAIDTLPLAALNDKFDLKQLLANELNLAKEDISGYDLYLYNRDKARVIGLDQDMFSSAKIDNLECTFCGLNALINSKEGLATKVLAIFDNEEVGSGTRQGADSDFLRATLERISSSLGLNNEEHLIAIANSFLVSADNAHALHPNHPELSDKLNAPLMNKGIAIKFNAAQSYTSDGQSASKFIEILKANNVPYQYFANRSDIRGGGTLGNISSSQVSIESVDIGLAQLAMHSSYETAGLKDIEYMYQGLKAFFESK